MVVAGGLADEVIKIYSNAERPEVIKEWVSFAEEDLRVSRLLYFECPRSSLYHFNRQ